MRLRSRQIVSTGAAFALALSAFVAPPQAAADTFDFVNFGGDGDWDTAVNWQSLSDPNLFQVPGPSDAAQVINRAVNKSGGVIALTDLQATNANLTLRNGVTVSVPTTLTGSNLNIVGTENQITGALTLDSNSAIYLDSVVGETSVTFVSGSSLTNANGGIRVIRNPGTPKTTFTNAGTLQSNGVDFNRSVLSGDYIVNSGAINMAAVEFAGGFTNEAAGTLTVGGGTQTGLLQFDRVFQSGNPDQAVNTINNAGTITGTNIKLVLSGMTLTGGGTTHLTDAIISSNGVNGQLDTSALIQNQTLTVDGNSVLGGAGAYEPDNLRLDGVELQGTGLKLQNDARLTFVGDDNTLSNQNVRFDDFTGGRIFVGPTRNAATLTVTSDANLSGNISSIAKTQDDAMPATLVNQGAISFFSGSGYNTGNAFIVFDSVRNEGVLTSEKWQQGGGLIIGVGTFDNAAGGVLAAHDGGIVFGNQSPGPPAIVNDGAITITGENRSAYMTIPAGASLTNNGTIAVTNGTLTLEMA